MIFASAVQSSSARNELRFPHSLTCIDSLDDITFWVLELATGLVCEKRKFVKEYTYLTGHAGVHLYKDILAILSIQNQCLYLLKVTDDGKLVDHRVIGYHNNPDDSLVLLEMERVEQEFKQPKSHKLRRSRRYQNASSHSVSARNLPLVASPTDLPGDTRISGIKQRLMSYLFRRAYASGDPAQLLHFSLVFDHFAELVMWRVHFMDDSTLLLKFGTIDNIMYRQNVEPITAQIVFFVVYSLATTKVTGVYESSSQELFNLYHSTDNFRGNAFDETEFLSTSVCNNKYAREITAQNIYTVRKARNGGPVQANKRVLATLPMNPQSFSPSPYFDHSLFHYDEKVISALDRVRSCPNDFPVKFYDRKRGNVLFSIESNATPQIPQPLGTARNSKRSVSYIFHPSAPFLITVQSAPLQLAVVNIHMRK